MATVSELESDPDFASLRETPGVFRCAAARYPLDPQGFLRKVMGRGRNDNAACGRWTDAVAQEKTGDDGEKHR